MLIQLERPAERPAPRSAMSDFGALYASNGFIGWLFAVTAPVAIILTVGSNGGLSEAEIASWIFGVFFVNGLITIAFCAVYREPLAFFWTIPGTVLVGQSLTHLGFAEVVGAYYATGVLMLVLGLTGWVKRAMSLVPLGIVMGMVAGVFLRFGLDLVHATFKDAAIAAPMVVAWLLLGAMPKLGRRLPPIIGALLAGAVAVVVFGRFDASAPMQLELIRPVVQAPAWSVAAIVELVVPLAITVLVVQNGQGFAVLRAAGHNPPINAVTVACGVGSLLAALVGAVSTCLTGPTNAIIVGSGERERQYTAGIVVGLLAILFGLFCTDLHKAFAQCAEILCRGTCRTCDAARAANRLRHGVRQKLLARRAGGFPGHGRRCSAVECRRGVLGTDRGPRRLGAAGAGGFRDRRNEVVSATARASTVTIRHRQCGATAQAKARRLFCPTS